MLRVFSPDLKEVVFQGAIDPHTPVGQGWLRASHRALDKKLIQALPALSHPHQESSRSSPARWSSSTSKSGRPRSSCRPGHRIALTIRGKDYVYGGPSGGKLSNFKNELTGCGPFLHDDLRDRPPQIFGGVTGLHFGGTARPYLLLPVIPPQKK